MPNPSIAIIGGGMAGLAAAAKLTQQGKPVVLFESGPTLGGRARGIDYKGLRLDNGQHILLGAYHETLALLKLADVAESDVMMRLPLALEVKDLISANAFLLKTNALLPAPLHLLWGLLSAKGVSLKEKVSAIRFMATVKRDQFKLAKDQSLASLLQAHNQSSNFIQYLWEPLCLAALNTPVNQASAQIFLNVLRDSFAKQKHDADALLAKTDLSSLISEPVAAYLLKNGSLVHTNSPIESIEPCEAGYQLKSHDQTQTFSHVILACGPHQLKKFSSTLPNLVTLTKHFAYQPITTIYIQYAEKTKLPSAMIGVINSLTQWIFDRGQICNQDGLIAVVISAHPLFKEPQATIVAKVVAELKQLFPQLTQPIWHKVITEKRATFSCETGLIRPKNKTPYTNLLIAGDYTAGDYPATIEGAVRSGINAAKLSFEID